MILHVLCVAAAVVLLAVVPPLLAGWRAGTGWGSPFVDWRRLWRKDGTGAGLAASAALPAAILACDLAAVLLVPTVLPDAALPFADILAVFALLAAGRLLRALEAAEADEGPGGAVASRTALFLAAAGPVALLVPSVLAGVAGSANLSMAAAALHEAPGLHAGLYAPLLLAAAAVAVLAWADLSFPAPPSLSGRSGLLRLAAVPVRWVAWLDLLAALLPPAAPESLPWAVLAWVAKLCLLAVAGLAAGRWLTPGTVVRPASAPWLATLLALVAVLLLALRGGTA